MYLGALNEGFALKYGGSAPSTFQSGSQTIPNMTQNACTGQGGSWHTYNPNNATFNSLGDCVLPVYSAMPAAPAPPPQINVSVPTNINTQVSPQVSPNFVQQDHPTNSPVTASTQATPTQSATTNDDGYLQQLAEQQKAFEQQMAAQEAQRQAELLSMQSALPAANPSPAQQVPAPVAQTVMVPVSPAPDASGYSAPVPVTGVTGFAQYEHYWPYALLAVAAIGAMVVMSKNKRKRS